MSIYATLWSLMWPLEGVSRAIGGYVKKGDAIEMKGGRVCSPPFHTDGMEDFVEIYAQAVPAHIGHPKYYPGDEPFAAFLPPVTAHSDGLPHRAVFICGPNTEKRGQEYHRYLLMLPGAEYEAISWRELERRITGALPGHLNSEVD